MDIVYKGPRRFTNAFSRAKIGKLMSDFMIIQTFYALINIISSSANIQATVQKSIPLSVLLTTLLRVYIEPC